MLKSLKRTLGVMVFLLVLTLWAPVVEAAAFSGGDGSESNPYQITTKQELNEVRNYPDANFILMQDIVFEESDFQKGGWKPISEFQGIFDGNNHLIKGIVYSSNNNFRGGLFETNNGTIKNLGLSECDYSVGVNDFAYMGGIAVYNYGIIQDSLVSGMITYGGCVDAGGICSVNYGTISRCVNGAKMGMVGDIPPGDYNRNVGGISAINEGTINSCMNLGIIYGVSDDAIGGICSSNRANGIVKNSVNYGAFVSRGLFNYPAGLIYREFGNTTGCYNVLNSHTAGVYKSVNGNIQETLQGYKNVLLKDCSKYAIPKLTNYFYKTYVAKAVNSFNTNSYSLSASGRSYNSIQVKWPADETGEIDGYLLFRQDEDVCEMEEGEYFQDIMVYNREIANITNGASSSYVDKNAIPANSNLQYFYKICPYYETDGVVVYGLYGGWTSSKVVDTYSEEEKDDYAPPVLKSLQILDTKTYTPGALRIKIVAEDAENKIATIKIFNETITINKQKVDQVVSVPISSKRAYGTYTLENIKLTDSEGNWVNVNATFYDNRTFTIKKEFDIEFNGTLSNKNVASELELMDEGKTVALTINSASGGILKKELLDAIKGKDKTLIVYCDSAKSCQWIFYGKEITGETKNLDLNVSYSLISGKDYGVSADILKIDYADNGKLPGKINFRIKSDYISAINNSTGNLYLYYNKGKTVVAEDTECQVIRDGSASWCYIDLSHNSTFFLSGKKLKNPISKQTISLSTTSYTYNGSERKPTVKITGLVKDTDYQVTYSNNINAGTAKVTIKGIGKYSGTVTKTFKIEPRKISEVTLSTTTYVYNGSVKRPSVTVRNSSGTKVSSSNYSVTYSSGRKYVGTYKVTVKGIENYTGTLTATFKIKPKATEISSVTAGGRNFTVKWKKVTSQATGYQIYYATKSDFSNTKKVFVTNADTISKKFSSLTAGTKYYVKVRTYKTVGDTKYYSSWSDVKTVRPKPVSTGISSLTAGTKSFTVKWDKVTSQVSGYQIYYATKSDFSNTKKVFVTSTSTTSKKFSSLKSGTKYYVKVRTYRTVGDTKYYSSWSKTKTVTVK